MEVIKITDIKRKDIPLYYINKYTAYAELLLMGNLTSKHQVDFSVEVTPISGKVYSIEEIKNLDYPSLPVKKALVEKIQGYDREGLLP